MASLNFPPTTPGVPGPEYTLNGIVYYWDGEKWTANTEDGFTDIFVDVSGDNMTGDLTLGTDNITLDATDGGVNCAYAVAGDPVADQKGVIIGEDGVLGYRPADEGNLPVFSAVWGGSSEPNQISSRIFGDGSATFTNRVTAKTLITGNPAGQKGVICEDFGTVFSYRPADEGSEPTYVSVWGGSSAPNQFSSQIFADGSANFSGGDVVITGSGNVKVGDPDNSVGSVLSPAGQNYARYDGAGSSVAAYSVLNGGTTQADAVVRINYDGSATFAAQKFRIASSGETTIDSPAVAADSNLFSCRSALNSGNVVASIKADGDATFDGQVNSGNLSTGAGCRFNPGGSIEVRRDTDPSFPALNVLYGSAANSVATIKFDGSATFAGNMNCGGSLVVSNSVFVGADNDSNRIAVSPHSSGSATLYIGNARISTSTFYEIWTEPDNDANYVTTTDVDEEGNTVETRVYNGPTLNVKTVIQELQQRVNDRDAVIADLTTRIQTLEGGNN